MALRRSGGDRRGTAAPTVDHVIGWRVAGVLADALAQPPEPHAELLAVADPGDGDRRPDGDVQLGDRVREVALGDPDTVAGVHPVVDGVAGGLGRGVVDDDVRAVAQAPARVEQAVGEVDPLVAVPEVARPAPDLLEGGAPDRADALPEDDDVAAGPAPGGPEVRHPAPRRREPGRVGAARLDDRDPVVDGILLREPGQHVGGRQEGVVVVEEEDVAAGLSGADVATLGDADVLLEVHRAHALGQALGPPAVADEHDVELDALLRQEGGERLRELGGAVAHRQDHGGHLGQRGHHRSCGVGHLEGCGSRGRARSRTASLL